MALIPVTSIALINAIADSPDNSRWYEFYDKYQPLIEAFLRSDRYMVERCPLDVDEIVQRTMVTFMKKIPNYRYDPETNGYFHNYIMRIARQKAHDYIRSRRREFEKIDRYTKQIDVLQPSCNDSNGDRELANIAELAKHRILTDESISLRDREVFRRSTSGESPESIACAFGITRNNVDQIKNRLMKKVRALAENLNNIESP